MSAKWGQGGMVCYIMQHSEGLLMALRGMKFLATLCPEDVKDVDLALALVALGLYIQYL
jgi:hypothetical protein